MISDAALTTISRLQLAPDETLVVSSYRVLSHEQHKRLIDNIVSAIPSLSRDRVLVMEDSMTLHVISTSQANQITGGARHGN